MRVFDRHQFFDPRRDADRDKVRGHLQAFVKADNTLMSIDHWLAPLTVADVLSVCTGSYLTALALTCTIYSLSKAFERSNAVATRTEKLNQLMDTYHWMLQGQGPVLTKDDLFMNVVEAIAPYVQTTELTPWDLTERVDNFSTRYRQILSGPLHQVDIATPVESNVVNGIYESIRSRISSSTVESAAVPAPEPEAITAANVLAKLSLYAGRFRGSYPYAAGVRSMYGYQDPNEIKALESVTMKR